MKTLATVLILTFISLSMISQENRKLPKSKVDYTTFIEITEEVQKHREARLVPLPVFLKLISEENTILLDTRSEAAYKRKHLKGAIHLNFSDFSEEKLASLIPAKETKILIYCNNNIEGDAINFMTKRMPLALNIPTFINLYGYGYQNLYELSSLVSVEDPRLEFEGSVTD